MIHSPLSAGYAGLILGFIELNCSLNLHVTAPKSANLHNAKTPDLDRCLPVDRKNAGSEWRCKVALYALCIAKFASAGNR